MKTADQILKLSQLTKGTLLYRLAEAKINADGFYTCTFKGKKTLIKK